MNKCICDVCNEKEASQEFQIKRRRKGVWGDIGTIKAFFNDEWGKLENIDICSDCAEKLLGLTEGNGK